ncbi:MAG: phenylacetate--CoA ligase [Ruminococcaceae bacterium]|nr:phenylacetate--CoA ligase [Oscillospiraceae bacterium]
MKYFDFNEVIPEKVLRNLQAERLIETVKRVYDRVAPYRKKMDEAGISPDDIKSLDDLKKLPFTEKQDLRDSYPYGYFACDMEDVVRIHASSGTTGKQTVVGYTERDLDVWATDTARALVAAGADNTDFVHVSYGYGLFTGGLGVNGGAEKIKAKTIPVSVGNTARQINIMKDFGSTVLCCTPSYALYMVEALKEAGISTDELSLKCGIFGAEPWSENMRAEIEKGFGIKAYDIYGLSEVMGPGVAYECCEQDGLHISDDHFIAEIIDPETGEVLEDGQEGELVFTCIDKEALPLIRYRTRDVSYLYKGECACGRSFKRMARPMGRTDDMLIIRGVNVFPSQIEQVLLETEHILAQYLITVDRVDNLDRMLIEIEMSPDAPFDAVRFVEEKERSIRAAIESTLGISAVVKLVSPKTLARGEGKAKRVIDNRNI